MYTVAIVFITLTIVYAFITLNVEKTIENKIIIDNYKQSSNRIYFNKIPDIYDKYYSRIHLSNYKHYLDDDGFRYNNKILLSNKKLCDIDENYNILNCKNYIEYENLNDDDLKVLYEFLPSPTDSQQYLTGLIFVKTSYIPTINNINIPMMILEYVDIEKEGKNYNIKNVERVDTYSVVNKKIEMANNIIEDISQYLRHYAKTKFKTSNYNPFVSEFGLTRLYYYNIDIDDKSIDKKFVRLQGSLSYGLITSKMKMLPNSYNYKTGLEIFVPTIVDGSNVWDTNFNNSYTISDWDAYNGSRIYYALTWLNTDTLFDEKWYTKYNYYNIYDDIFNNLDENTYLVGLNEQAAIKKNITILNHVKEIDIEIKTVKQYFKDMFNLDFDFTNYENPFFGSDFPFDILIDNSSNLTYPYIDINNETIKIINRYKITFALPIVIDKIDTFVNNNNDYKGIYYRTYVITTIK